MNDHFCNEMFSRSRPGDNFFFPTPDFCGYFSEIKKTQTLLANKNNIKIVNIFIKQRETYDGFHLFLYRLLLSVRKKFGDDKIGIFVTGIINGIPLSPVRSILSAFICVEYGRNDEEKRSGRDRSGTFLTACLSF